MDRCVSTATVYPLTKAVIHSSPRSTLSRSRSPILLSNTPINPNLTTAEANAFIDPNSESPLVLVLLVLRLVTLVLLVMLLTLHVRSLRVFRWEQTVTGGLLLSYCMAELGLALCAGTRKCGGHLLQAYICSMGGVLFTINAVVLWQRWRTAGDLTRVVAELLVTLGVQIRRQILLKASLSLIVGLAMIADLAITPNARNK